MRSIFLLLLLSSAVLCIAAAPPPRIVAASGRWAALADAGQCDAASLSLLPASKKRARGRVSLTFDRGARHGQFAAALSKPVMAGASVMLTIDDQPFLLVARHANAWSRGPVQEAAILAALRGAARMRIEGRSQRGARFIDRYDLAGAPTAIDAAAACAVAL
ncbi:MAG: hypothetical protein M3Q88_01950 [Pseudomonadota bacterium]|nr:hypothetical protein [Pseudomonadota bacterium]